MCPRHYRNDHNWQSCADSGPEVVSARNQPLKPLTVFNSATEKSSAFT